jgi:hypothetical protein
MVTFSAAKVDWVGRDDLRVPCAPEGKQMSSFILTCYDIPDPGALRPVGCSACVRALQQVN